MGAKLDVFRTRKGDGKLGLGRHVTEDDVSNRVAVLLACQQHIVEWDIIVAAGCAKFPIAVQGQSW